MAKTLSFDGNEEVAMNVPGSRMFRSAWRPVVGALALGSLIIGCDKATDPAPVALDELKFAFGLKILDQGNGAVRLKWTGVNNEEDFSGYNIYGAKDNTTVAALEGKAIKLLDDKGDVDEAGKATLGKMGYNGKDWETAGPATNEKGDFAVYPYYKLKNGEDAILPSCLPSGTAGTDGVECKTLTAEGNTGSVNGPTYFDVTGLKIGSNYCFTVLATLKSGKKAAPATSEVRCIVPRASVAPTGSFTWKRLEHATLDLAALRTACGTSPGATCTLTAPATKAESNSSCTGNQSLCLHYFQGGIPYFTASSYSGIQDLGYYENGFNDATLPKIPKIAMGTIQNIDGYSLKGQSVPVIANHLYVVADGEKDNSTSFYYHLIFVKSLANSTSTETATGTLEMRISNKIDTP